jgi:hypothetical protein
MTYPVLDEPKPSGTPSASTNTTLVARSQSPIRIHLSSNTQLCLGSWDRWNSGSVRLVKCSDPASKLTVKGDMFAFGTPWWAPTCLDVRQSNTNLPAQNWDCTPGNPNQQFVWYGSGSGQMNLGWRGAGQYCLAVNHLWTATSGPPREGQQIGWKKCNTNDSLQRWQWSGYYDF